MSNNNSSKKIDTNIIVAIITLIGTIAVAAISNLDKFAALRATPVPPTSALSTQVILPTAAIFTDTPSPTAVPTDTVPAGDPSSTPEPPTNTPEPLPTPTLIPAGADWTQNCISALWMPYPSDIPAISDDKGCLKQQVGSFYTTPGKMGFTFDDKVSQGSIYGMFTKLPASGTASLDVHLTQVIKGEVLVGIFSGPDMTQKGVLLVLPQNKSVKEPKMFLRRMPEKDFFSEPNTQVTSSAATYDVYFQFDGGSVSVNVKDNQIELGTVTVPGEKWLFVGYQVANGGKNTLLADYSNLVIQGQ